MITAGYEWRRAAPTITSKGYQVLGRQHAMEPEEPGTTLCGRTLKEPWSVGGGARCVMCESVIAARQRDGRGR
jgi:hypothetical protein